MTDFPHTLKIATVWLVVTLVVFFGFSAYERQQQRASFSVDGAAIEIRRAADGHYHWPGTLNGRAVDFLVDTGATTSAISADLAEELGLEAIGSVQSSTAGGMVRGSVARADLVLDGGVSAARLPLVVLPALGDKPLLGMDVLGRLRWTQEGGVLRIEAAGSR